MTAFTDAPSGVSFPARYRDAVPELRLRVVDPTESQVPEWVESAEVGDRLGAIVTWGISVVPVEISRKWGVSVDELLATAMERVHELPFERGAIDDRGQATGVEATVGHRWTSSLITRLDKSSKGPEGAIVAIPRSDILLTAPVADASTVDDLEMMMLLCDELYHPADAGISPHVWWSWYDRLYRITDRQRDGSVGIEPSANVSAFYFAGAVEHLVNTCEECGRTGPL